MWEGGIETVFMIDVERGKEKQKRVTRKKEGVNINRRRKRENKKVNAVRWGKWKIKQEERIKKEIKKEIISERVEREQDGRRKEEWYNKEIKSKNKLIKRKK